MGRKFTQFWPSGSQISTKSARFETVIATLLVSIILDLIIPNDVSAPSVEQDDYRKVDEWSSAYSLYTAGIPRKRPADGANRS